MLGAVTRVVTSRLSRTPPFEVALVTNVCSAQTRWEYKRRAGRDGIYDSDRSRPILASSERVDRLAAQFVGAIGGCVVIVETTDDAHALALQRFSPGVRR